MYEKEQAPSQKITLPNQIKCDLRGLDTKVGQITNYSTSMMAMLPLFKGEKQLEQKLEIEKRLKICRNLQGEEIDKIKGTNPPSFPKSWKHWININEDDNDIIKSDKYKYNSMVVKKKPYFFVYLYQSLMNEYKEYTKSFNNLSLKQFGCPIKNLIRKQNKSDSEMNLVRKYQKYSPVLETDCIMNKVCKSFENAEFDIKYKNNGISLLDRYFDHKNINETLTNDLYNIYKEFKNQKKFKGISTIVENYGIQDDDMNDLFKSIFFSNRDNCKNKVYDLMSNTKEIFDNLIYMCKIHNLNYDIVWDIMGEDILDIINYENNVIIIEDEKGVEYLGKRYSIKEISLESIGDEI